MTDADRPLLAYPLDWTYKLVGTDEQDLRRAVKVMLSVCLDRDSGDRAAAFEDIFWALVNSAEFIHRN